MSKKDDYQNNDTQEPWEQPIYDTDNEDLGSRAQQRRSKNGNKMFLIILVALLAVSIVMLVGFYMLVTHDNKRAAVPESSTTETTTVSSTTAESSTAESSTSESSTTESSTSESSSSSSEPAVADPNTDANNGADTAEGQQNNGQTDQANENQNDAAQNGTDQNAGQQGQTDQNTTDQNQNQTDQQTQAGDTVTVRAGEGPNQVAARAGISVETLYQLNGIDPNNFMLHPGQELRIR